MGSWTEYETPGARAIALGCARGCYQRAVIDGDENLSGSTLAGKAKRYGVHYRRSRENLLARCRTAGVRVSERRGDHGRRILVLG
jgi:hypothetical protein